MTEYIERKTGVSIFRAKANMAVLMDAAPYFEKAAQMLEQLPAADVAPVVHGRWIYDKKAQRPYCSVCKGYFHGATNSPMSYCPNCGAKMDGGADNEDD